MGLNKMKPPITSAQAMSHPAVFETVNSLGKMADELRAKVEALTKERDALSDRIKALEADAGRYRWISMMIVEDRFEEMERGLSTLGDAEECTQAELDAAFDAAIKGTP